MGRFENSLIKNPFCYFRFVPGYTLQLFYYFCSKIEKTQFVVFVKHSKSKGEKKSRPPLLEYVSLYFHYFFMRKFWFLYLAKALVIFPGGFGTLDELMELLTLIQTDKIRKKVPVVVYDKKFWNKIINFDQLVKMGTISKEDMKLFYMTDSIDDAYKYLTKEIVKAHLKGKNF